MKKFIAAMLLLVVLYFAADALIFRFGFFIDFHPDAPVTTRVTAKDGAILLDRGRGPEPFVIRGVNLGNSLPGHSATDYPIDEKTYLRWFGEIQRMGANTLRVYIALPDDFYNAFYRYNRARLEAGEDPLYLLHGVWVNDYIQSSHRDAFHSEFIGPFIEDCETVVDIIHGRKKMQLGRGQGTGSYRNDISPWVLGYILGVDWDDRTIAYTNQIRAGMAPYQGEYLYARDKASPFESFLAEVCDRMISYESRKYHQQRLVAFANHAATDPFLYPPDITLTFLKSSELDAENIGSTPRFISSQFASYHVFPFSPDYLKFVLDYVEVEKERGTLDMMQAVQSLHTWATPISSELTGHIRNDFYDGEGRLNSYLAYLRVLNRHHELPVVIAEFGLSTGRSKSQRDGERGISQGYNDEVRQGRDLVSMWHDIREAGSAGGCVFEWQDEWHKKTWNTMHAVNLTKMPYWQNAQSNLQHFGLLAFDPGKEKSVCYVDGDISEWTEKDLVLENEGHALSMKQDEKYLYLLIRKDGMRPMDEKLYVPFDITPKSGSTYSEEGGLRFERPADFLLVIDGRYNSRLYVQERYNMLRAMFNYEMEGRDPFINPPDRDTPVFSPVRLMMNAASPLLTGTWTGSAQTTEIGLLRHGNANPSLENFDSLADFRMMGDYIEIRLPWMLLNFSSPSEALVHDDYYEHYGVEDLKISKIYVGLGDGERSDLRIPMFEKKLKPWGRHVAYHERLKLSYELLRACWTQEE